MRTVMLACLLMLASCGLPSVCIGQNQPQPRGQTATILLVDDHDVLYRSGTKRVFYPLKRHAKNPMLPADKPWETTIAYCSVYRNADTGKYQLWYQAWNGDKCTRCVYLCYAESKDGINWVKPNVGLYEYDGSKDNNILLPLGYGGSVIFDPRDPDPSRRYKSAYWVRAASAGGYEHHKHSGTAVAWSPDGIHWTEHSDNPVILGSEGNYVQPPFEGDTIIDTDELRPGPPLSTSDVHDLIWDPKREVYAIYSKTWLDGPKGLMHWKRAVVRTESNDFIHWTKPQLVVAPDEFDGEGGDHEVARTAGGGGSGGVQLHSGPAFVYNNMYFAMLQVMDAEDSGNMPIELAISHDGYDWQRPFRDTFFLPSLDDKTKFDASVIWSNATPVFLDDQFRFYYGAYGHEWNSEDPKQISGIGLATMPRDRFAGVRPIGTVGQITFKAVDFSDCRQITLNADATNGTIRAEVLNENGYRVRGYSKDDANPIQGDSLRHLVAWKERDISELPAGRYRLRLHLENAEVFALTFVDKTSSPQPNSLQVRQTDAGVRFGMWGDKPSIPAPTLFVFAGSIEQSLGDPYYRQCGNALAEKGYLCVSLDLPSHGEEKRPDEPLGLRGWRHRIQHDEENFVAEFNTRISHVLDYLVEKGYTDSDKVVACGTSRGGFAALHFAASDPRVKCVAAFAPVTDLAKLQEFAGAQQHPAVRTLALFMQADNLADRPIWIVIGDRDERVSTTSTIWFAQKVWQASTKKNVNSGLELHVMPEPRGHTTPAGAADDAAAWILEEMVGM